MAAPGCKGPSFPVWPCSCSPFSSSCYWCCKEPSSSIKRSLATPLGVQWLRLCTSNAGYAGMTLVREAGYHIWHIMAGWERILVANNGNLNCSMEQEGSRWVRAVILRVEQCPQGSTVFIFLYCPEWWLQSRLVFWGWQWQSGLLIFLFISRG